MPAENKAYSKTFNSKSDKQNKNRAKQQKKSIASLPLFERINVFLTGYLDKIFWITFVLTLLSGLLLFDIRISLSGDDSAYIIRAYDFIHHFTYPGFQGPLYPILLSPFIGIFGVKVVPLKLISLILMLGFNWLIYKSFKDRIPALLITSMLLLMAINSFFLYYASQTYSEALFIFLQALTFLVFFKYFLHNEDHTTALQIRNYIFLTLCILGLILTRTIGITAFIAIAGYFLLKKQWKNLLGFTVSFAVLLTLFEFIRYLV
ncbi:MAG: hypothetical protein Q8867_08570, partial [Bacteroidota bacterium]|nr:hypothetical protein [Bacteroidota bacterium]